MHFTVKSFKKVRYYEMEKITLYHLIHDCLTFRNVRVPYRVIQCQIILQLIIILHHDNWANIKLRCLKQILRSCIIFIVQSIDVQLLLYEHFFFACKPTEDLLE